MNSMDAKEFIVSRITDQAALENVDLSEVERKMLYFSERHPSLPDISQVATEFDQNYNMFEYEAKIVGLVRNAFRRDKKVSPEKMEKWVAARRALRWEDHYIKVMVGHALKYEHRTRDFLIYLGVAGAVILLIILKIILSPGR